MIKEIVANIKTNTLDILFRMDSGNFDENIIETIESLGCKYLIKAKSYSTPASKATNSSIVFVKDDGYNLYRLDIDDRMLGKRESK